MKLTQEEKKKCVDLYKQGKTSREIAPLFNTSHMTVLRLLRFTGYPARCGRRKIPARPTYICRICHKEKPTSDMVKNTHVFAGVESRCKECLNKRVRYANFRYEKYGITRKDYDDMFNKQNGKCAICGCKDNGYKGKTKKDLSIDHCHITGKVRGLLCDNCNTAIGHLRDSPELLRNAIKYLENTM